MNAGFVMRSMIGFVHARMARRQSFADACVKEYVLCPEEVGRVPPAIAIEGAIERMRNFVDEGAKKRLLTSFAGGEARHAPTRAFVFDDARIAAGSLLSHGFRYPIRTPKESGLDPGAVALDRIAFCTGPAGDAFFGHCLNEDLPQMLLAEDFGTPARLPSRNWPDLAAYKTLLDLDWMELASAEIKQATVFWDYSQNSSRRQRFQEFRSRLRRKLTPTKPGGVFYLRRGRAGAARSPVNEDEICAFLERRGVDILDIEHNDARAFLENILDRKIMIGVEGSQMAHLIYTQMTGGGVLAFLPPDRPRQAIKDACDAINVRFGVVVGHAAEGGYRVDLDDLGRTLDKLEGSVSNLESV